MIKISSQKLKTIKKAMINGKNNMILKMIKNSSNIRAKNIKMVKIKMNKIRKRKPAPKY